MTAKSSSPTARSCSASVSAPAGCARSTTRTASSRPATPRGNRSKSQANNARPGSCCRTPSACRSSRTSSACAWTAWASPPSPPTSTPAASPPRARTIGTSRRSKRCLRTRRIAVTSYGTGGPRPSSTGSRMAAPKSAGDRSVKPRSSRRQRKIGSSSQMPCPRSSHEKSGRRSRCSWPDAVEPSAGPVIATADGCSPASWSAATAATNSGVTRDARAASKAVRRSSPPTTPAPGDDPMARPSARPPRRSEPSNWNPGCSASSRISS